VTTNKIYFGVTHRDLKVRWRQHKNRNPENCYVRSCIKKYGEDNFTIAPLFIFSCVGKAYKKEIYLINKHKTNICKYPDGVGMNMTNGGERGNYGYIATKLHRENLRKALTGKKKSNTENMRKAKLGKKNPMYGYKMPIEERKRKSDMWKTDLNPMKGKKGKNNPLYGRKRPEHVRAALKKAAMKKARPVIQIDNSGKEIGWFESTNAASRAVGIKNGVHSVCCGKQKLAGGYYWRFA